MLGHPIDRWRRYMISAVPRARCSPRSA